MGLRETLLHSVIVSVLSASFLIARPVQAQQADPWWARDKAAHLTVSLGASALTYGLVRSRSDNRLLAAGLGMGITVAAGAVKEVLDAAGLGTPSWRDFAWDAIGALVGTLFALGLDVGITAVAGTGTDAK
jgi:putative lipoprotein